MSVKNVWQTIRPHLLEMALLGLVLLLATAVRLWQLDQVPAGLHFDEAIDLQQSLRILDGARPIYVQEGWGREALYYYWVALILPLLPNNMLALRLTAVLCSLGMIVASYLLARQALGRTVGLLTAVLLSLNYWSLFTARFGVRHMSLPLMLGLALLFFWYAYQLTDAPPRRKIITYGAAGLLLGLTLYTYQSARFAPFIFLVFFAYLFIWQRPRFQTDKIGLLLLTATAVCVAVPLFMATQQANIELETRDWLVEPMLRLLAGDPSLVWQNGLDTLGMFSLAGDPLVAYNVPGRPVFVPIGLSLFLYIGLGVACWRWRQPIYPLLLIWLVVMLAPTVLTTSAPNYNRAIAAQVPTMLLTAVGMVETLRWLHRQWGIGPTAVAAAWLLVGLVGLGRASWHDYFEQWPAQPLIPIQYNASVSQAARTIDQLPDARPLLVNTRGIEDADPIIFGSILDRTDIDTRWVDTGMALVMPAGQTESRILLGNERWIDTVLSQFAQLQPQPYFSNEYVALYETQLAQWQTWPSTAVYPLPIAATAPWAPFAEQPPLEEPTFGNRLQLQGVYRDTAVFAADQPFTFLTDWHVLQDGEAGSLAFFVHLLDEQGNLLAQQDGLGFPPHSWQAGDRLVHLHRLQPAEPLAAGTYWIQLGLYRRENGQRWLLAGEAHDRLLLGPLVIRP